MENVLVGIQSILSAFWKIINNWVTSNYYTKEEVDAKINALTVTVQGMQLKYDNETNYLIVDDSINNT